MIPQTRQLIILCLGAVSLCTIIAWGFGSIETDNAMVILLPIITGFFTLLKGEQ